MGIRDLGISGYITPELVLMAMARDVPKGELMHHLRSRLPEYTTVSDLSMILGDKWIEPEQIAHDTRLQKQIARTRAEMLSTGPIYIKPVIGCLSNLVMRLSYDPTQDEVVIDAEDGRVHDFVLDVLKSSDTERTRTNSTLVRVGREIRDLLFDLNQMYIAADNASYAEPEIDSPKIRGGQIWETRILYQSTDLKEHDLTKFDLDVWYSKRLEMENPFFVVIYCKLEDRYGKHEHVETAVSEAIQTIDQDEVDSKTKQYIDNMLYAANRIKDEIGLYLDGIRKEAIGEVPKLDRLDGIPVTSLSMDFKLMVHRSEEGIQFRPILIDNGPSYGADGLNTVDTSAFALVYRNNEQIQRRTLELFDEQ